MYTIEFSAEAEADLKWFSRREQNIILDGIKTNLRYEPTRVTTNRKPCQREPDQVADWESASGSIGSIMLSMRPYRWLELSGSEKSRTIRFTFEASGGGRHDLAISGVS